MKKLFLIVIVSTGLLACNGDGVITTDLVNNPNTASGEADTSDLPILIFEEEVYDWGSITQGEKVQYAFKFKNEGKSDMIITSARGSCGCTVPEWPRKPIPPGGEGVIDVVFNSEGREGKQHKQVTVVANTHPSTSVFAIKGYVVAPNTDKNE